MRSYFFFMQGMKSVSFEPRSGWAAKDSPSYRRGFSTLQKDEQTLFVNLEEDG